MNKHTLKIVLIGSGYAANWCALALYHSFGNNIDVTMLHATKTQVSRAVYGNFTSPAAYEQNRLLGVSEAEMMVKTSTSFCFAAQYKRWGDTKRTWMQCFHQPFISHSGTDFHHHITRDKRTLSDYLISAKAAELGRFAHPPVDDRRSALSRAEYAYQFNSKEWASLYEQKITKLPIRHIDFEQIEVVSENAQIEHIMLDKKNIVQADLYIDTSELDRTLLSALTNDFEHLRTVDYVEEHNDESGPLNSYVSISDNKNTWTSKAHLRDKKSTIRVSEIDGVNEDLNCLQLGFHRQAWVGNCVALGNSAYVVEPFSHAPYTLLQRDIERLIELLPLRSDMSLEQKEFNRRYSNDVQHAQLFHHAMSIERPAVEYPNNEKLRRKIEQFIHRGVVVKYDLEPFNTEEWLILHYGMGRIPNDYNRLIDKDNQYDSTQALDNMKRGVAHLASKMPPHGLYLEKFIEHIKSNISYEHN